jgi:hypothetical protein
MSCEISDKLTAGPNQIKQQSQRQSAEESRLMASGALHVLELAPQKNRRQQGTKQSQNGTPHKWDA